MLLTADTARDKIQAFEWEIDQGHRHLVICSLAIMSALCENIPFLILNLMLVIGYGKYDTLIVASTVLSAFLLGVKTINVKELVNILQRRKELHHNLELLRRSLEGDMKHQWLVSSTIDQRTRQDRAEVLRGLAAHEYSPDENSVIEQGLSLFSAFAESSDKAHKLKHGETVIRMETKHDGKQRLLGMVEVLVRGATPELLSAYLLDANSHHMRSLLKPTIDVRTFVQEVNERHTIVFYEKKLLGYETVFRNRTFLNSLVAKKISTDPEPAVFVVASVPITSHPAVAPDEKNLVRAEYIRCFKLTLVGPALTKLNYTCWIDLKGHFPMWFFERVVTPQQLGLVAIIQVYFQQLKPIADCDEADGVAIGHMLIEMVLRTEEHRKSGALRAFVHKTAMLRDSEFAHFASMLTHMLIPESQSQPGAARSVSANSQSICRCMCVSCVLTQVANYLPPMSMRSNLKALCNLLQRSAAAALT